MGRPLPFLISKILQCVYFQVLPPYLPGCFLPSAVVIPPSLHRLIRLFFPLFAPAGIKALSVCPCSPPRSRDHAAQKRCESICNSASFYICRIPRTFLVSPLERIQKSDLQIGPRPFGRHELSLLKWPRLVCKRRPVLCPSCLLLCMERGVTACTKVPLACTTNSRDRRGRLEAALYARPETWG